MSGLVHSQTVVVGALQRFASALEDMAEELPSQLAQVKHPQASPAQLAEVLAVVEKQLRWLADDMARTRQGLTAKENSHDRNC